MPACAGKERAGSSAREGGHSLCEAQGFQPWRLLPLHNQLMTILPVRVTPRVAQ